MTDHEQEKILQLLVATAEVMGTELKPNALMLMVADLDEYDFQAVTKALTRCRKELSGKLTLKAILDILAPAGGWLTANEAWAQCLPAADEANSVVWTPEARRAWFVALPILSAGDKVGARMAFVAAYDRNVDQAKNNGRTPQHELSAGFDAEKRLTVEKQAQETGLLAPPTPPADQKVLPNLSAEQCESNRQKIRAGLVELGEKLAVASKQRDAEAAAARIQRMQEVNERFDRERAAVLAAINEDNGQ